MLNRLTLIGIISQQDDVLIYYQCLPAAPTGSINDDRAKKIVSLYLVNSESTSDDPNSTSNTNPSIESLINSLPPGTVPISWVLESCPSMMPRFFSIVSCA